MRKTIIPSIAAFLIAVTLFSNCNKKKDSTPTPEATTTPAAACFNNQYDGTYVGSGFYLSAPFTSGTLTVSKASCQVVNLSLYISAGGGASTQATQLVLNSSSAYDGKQANGNNITITPGGGNNIQINAVGSYTFNGHK